MLMRRQAGLDIGAWGWMWYMGFPGFYTLAL